MTDFVRFFKQASGGTDRPFPYQERLARMKFDDIPDTLHLPTGSGKTSAAVLSLWLWRIYNKEPGIPRRLVYCLPMRALVEQTAKSVKTWLGNLEWGAKVDVKILTGGSENDIKEIRLEKPCIIIGTQDILLSGALNHMYGQRPRVWPIAMGLLNNDSMWVMDEVQIMGPSLPTSLQLDAFRRTYGTFGPTKSVWMSATIDTERLDTADNPYINRRIFRLGQNDHTEELDKRNNAVKILHRIDLPTKDGRYTEDDVKKLLSLRRSGSMVIIANTTERAQELYLLVGKNIAKETRCILIHSRFRPDDRARLNQKIHDINDNSDAIIISTQVLETGVDLSVRTMVTELAPWPSMVQRFGRCNRRGDTEDGDEKSALYWIDLDKKSYQPYNPQKHDETYDDMDYSRNILTSSEGKSMSPSVLSKEKISHINSRHTIHSVIRRRDIETLFDTTADIGGSHVDVTKFVRDDDSDVHVFWRHVRGDHRPRWNELCSMSLKDLCEFVESRKDKCTVWNPVSMEWKRIDESDIFPGMIVRIEPAAGGYTPELGLWIKHSGRVEEIDLQRNSGGQIGNDVTLQEHTMDVLGELGRMLNELGISSEYSDAVRMAAKWHDVGKIHRIFQEFIRPNVGKALDAIWAKSGRRGKNIGGGKGQEYERRGFRHEVASALAFLDAHDEERYDLAAYLIMSHHGVVRLAMRGLGRDPENNVNRIAGIVHGEMLCEKDCNVHEDVVIRAGLVLDASISGMGGKRRSWLSRTTSLLKRHGPFRLAYLETALRKADSTASIKKVFSWREVY